jgi:hypothetical protein
VILWRELDRGRGLVLWGKRGRGEILWSPVLNLIKKRGQDNLPPSYERWCLIHFVHFFAATIRDRLTGLDGLEGVALDAYVGFVFLRVGRLSLAFATARTTAHSVSSSKIYLV